MYIIILYYIIMATHQKKHIKNTNTKELIIKDSEAEEYGEVINPKGDARFEVKLIQSGFNIIAKTRGSLIKGPNKQKIEKGNIVLLQRDMSTYDEKYFIIHRYIKENVKNLKKAGELATYVLVEEETDKNVVFEDDEDKIKIIQQEIDDDFIAGI